MKFTKNIISRDEAFNLAPDYVNYIENKDFDILFDIIMPSFEKMKRGHTGITFCDGVYLRIKISSLDSKSYMAVDGPVVRVSNGEYSWRVDGDGYAFPIK